MTQKWNLQDIRPAEPRKRRPAPRPMNQEERPKAPPMEKRENIPEIVIEDGRKNSSKRLWISILIFAVIVGGAVALSAMMAKTEITVYPEHREPNVSAEFTAYPDKRDNALSYEILTLESTSESQVKATGQVQVEEQATGMIEIKKTTPGAERLIKNTRFRTPDGLVYRIQESVVVPGSVTSETGANMPGTIQAEVFADDVGEEYNVPAGTTFDIPGFEENGLMDLYNTISATAATDLSGGFSGPQFQIDEGELQTARQKLQVDLRNTLLARIENERPADFIAFPGAVAVTYNQLPAVEYGNELVTIREQAILQIPLFQATEFGSFLAKETIPTYEGDPVRVEDPSVLTFMYTSATTSSSVIANEPSLTFKLTGKPLLIWEYDPEMMAENLAGLPKTAIHNATRDYPGIIGARVHMTPFWKRAFPEDPTEIIVIEELKDPAELTTE
ncbi:MAG: hypothetical protein KC877_00445 [Candidatus Kaiserbacteria bacterium]|nr:hypothetical protein [Candidatus Kaiserbacteria bacterium]MCB9816020.1 hypothetical protein [Candidatus Nomurabacteria bacterium]